MARHLRKPKATEEQRGQWAEQRAAKVEAAERLLTEGLRRLQTDSGWQDMLRRMASRDRLSPARLSFSNQMRVAVQRDDVDRVATFQAWKKLGRNVRKGEHSIAIMRPVVLGDREATKQPDAPPVSGERKRVFFTTMALFAYDQTDGEPLVDPYEEVPDLTGGEAFEHGVDKLREVALALPDGVVRSITLRPREQSDRKHAHGWYNRSERSITVLTDRTPAQQFKTLCHELGHSMLHADGDHHSSPEREVEAESVAFVVCHALGLDASDASFNYVAIWGSRNAGDKDAAKLVMTSGARITKAAHTLLDALLGPQPSTTGEDA